MQPLQCLRLPAAAAETGGAMKVKFGGAFFCPIRDRVQDQLAYCERAWGLSQGLSCRTEDISLAACSALWGLGDIVPGIHGVF